MTYWAIVLPPSTCLQFLSHEKCINSSLLLRNYEYRESPKALDEIEHLDISELLMKIYFQKPLKRSMFKKRSQATLTALETSWDGF